LARRDKPGRRGRSSAEARSLGSRERESPPIGSAIPGFLAQSGEGRERAGNHATRWLCWQSAVNPSPKVKFPDLRENTGKFRSARLPARSMSPVSPGKSIGKVQISLDIRTGKSLGRTGNFATATGNAIALTGHVTQDLRRFKSWARNRLDLQLQKLLATVVVPHSPLVRFAPENRHAQRQS
jgi:hypothetical protein